jgi:site-specific recombinase XerD
MTALLDRYLADFAERDVSPATLRAIRSDVSQLTIWWEERYRRSFEPTQLLDRDLRQWQVHRQKVEARKPTTINRGLSSVRGFCAWLVEERLLPENPASSVTDITLAPLSPRSLPDDAIDALLRTTQNIDDHALRLRDAALLALLVYVGLRSQEACDLQLRDLDIRGGTITVRSGKGKKPRRVPLHADAQRTIQRYLHELRCPTGMPAIGSEAEREPLLGGKRMNQLGQPFVPGMQTRDVRGRIQTLGRDAAKALHAAASHERDLERTAILLEQARQLEALSPHTLRHSLARRLLKKGATLSEVQRILGHTRLSTTGIYLTPSEDDLRDAISRAGV